MITTLRFSGLFIIKGNRRTEMAEAVMNITEAKTYTEPSPGKYYVLGNDDTIIAKIKKHKLQKHTTIISYPSDKNERLFLDEFKKRPIFSSYIWYPTHNFSEKLEVWWMNKSWGMQKLIKNYTKKIKKMLQK